MNKKPEESLRGPRRRENKPCVLISTNRHESQISGGNTKINRERREGEKHVRRRTSDKKVFRRKREKKGGYRT